MNHEQSAPHQDKSSIRTLESSLRSLHKICTIHSTSLAEDVGSSAAASMRLPHAKPCCPLTLYAACPDKCPLQEFRTLCQSIQVAFVGAFRPILDAQASSREKSAANISERSAPHALPSGLVSYEEVQRLAIDTVVALYTAATAREVLLRRRRGRAILTEEASRNIEIVPLLTDHPTLSLYTDVLLYVAKGDYASDKSYGGATPVRVSVMDRTAALEALTVILHLIA